MQSPIWKHTHTHTHYIAVYLDSSAQLPVCENHHQNPSSPHVGQQSREGLDDGPSVCAYLCLYLCVRVLVNLGRSFLWYFLRWKCQAASLMLQIHHLVYVIKVLYVCVQSVCVHSVYSMCEREEKKKHWLNICKFILKQHITGYGLFKIMFLCICVFVLEQYVSQVCVFSLWVGI